MAPLSLGHPFYSHTNLLKKYHFQTNKKGKEKKNTPISIKQPITLILQPIIVTQAFKHREWRDAMTEELNALATNGKWELVPCEPYQNVIGCKWVF